LWLIVQVGCGKHAAPIHSPDGGYVVTVTYYMQGALAADYARVKARRWWNPFTEEVHASEGAYDFRN